MSMGFVVFNMHCFPGHFIWDPSNRLENMECDPKVTGLRMGRGNETETDFLQKFHCRGTLAMNIAIFGFALECLEKNQLYYVLDVFLGEDDPHLGGGDCYNCIICQNIASMFPFRDIDLAKHMRKLYPSASVLEILGPALTKRVVMAEPFFRFLPPLSDSDETNSGPDNNEEDVHIAPLFENLPTPLEPLTEEIIIENGMGVWLDPNHRISWWQSTSRLCYSFPSK